MNTPQMWIGDALRRAAEEIRREDHAGWGNTCEFAADYIDRLRAERDALRSAVRWALGYDEGDPDFSESVNDARKYAWRIELRRRAGSGIDAALAQTGANDVDR